MLMSAPGLAQTVDGKAESKQIPRTPEGKPDFSGFFNIQYTPNMAMGKEETIPYTARGRAAYANHDAKDDPTSNCWLPGVPRIMQSPYPAQLRHRKQRSRRRLFDLMRFPRPISR